MAAKQMNFRLPDHVRAWVRREAADQEKCGADVITELVEAEIERRSASDVTKPFVMLDAHGRPVW